MEVWSCFYEIQEQDVFELVDSILNNMERISTKKKMKTISLVQCSKD